MSGEYLYALSQAIFVTVLWSSSWVIIKFGLEEMPPLLFAGLRYLLGALILCLVILMKKNYRIGIKNNSKTWWANIIIYGVLFIAITQGFQFLALDLLPAITVSFILNLTPFIVILLSIIYLKENPLLIELFFFILVLIGLILYFIPLDLETMTGLSLIVLIILILSNAFSSILGRSINRSKEIPPLIITGLSMATGSIILLFCGIAFEGIEIIFSLSFKSLVFIVWLSVANTAVAFTLWNNAMRKLRAMDITIVNCTMLPQTVLLSVIFLGESPLLKEWIGLFLLAVSIFAIQLIQAKKDIQIGNSQLKPRVK